MHLFWKPQWISYLADIISSFLFKMTFSESEKLFKKRAFSLDSRASWIRAFPYLHICLCTYKSLHSFGKIHVYTTLYREAQKPSYTYSVSLKGVVLISSVDNTHSLIPLWFSRKPLHPLPFTQASNQHHQPPTHCLAPAYPKRTQRSHFVRDWAVLCPSNNGSTPLTENAIVSLTTTITTPRHCSICRHCCHLGATIWLTLKFALHHLWIENY